MSDSDDQDKTRLQPRRKPAASGAEPAARGQRSAAPGPSNPRPAKVKPAGAGNDSTQFVPPAGAPRAPAGAVSRNRDRDRTLSLSPQDPKAGKESGGLSLQARDTLKNRFVLERVIGAGGMGVVYKAKDLLKVEAKDRDPYVAIKVLGEEFKSHPEAFIALQRESRKTQRIAHPNIVNVYDFDKDGETVFMTMEFLEGTPLDKLIKKYRATGLPHQDVWLILGGICSALAYAHDQNIIHSDLKPGNIFVTNHTVAKVFDFGIARAVAKAEHTEIGDSADDKTVFDAGNLGALTPAYASLEMLEGDPPDVRDDIYALGCIAYELFTGVHPFKRKNAKEAKRVGRKPRRIEGITKHQWRIIECALAFEREDRIETVKEFWSQLTKKHARPYKAWFIMLVLTSVSSWLGYEYYASISAPQVVQLSEDDFRGELEVKIRTELVQQHISELLLKPTFDERWENALWEEVQQLQSMVPADHDFLNTSMDQITELYINRIRSEVDAKQFEVARKHIANARRYVAAESASADELDEWLANIDQAIADIKREREQQLEQQRISLQQQEAQLQRQREEERRQREVNSALASIDEQLQCNTLLSMAELASAVRKIRAVDPAYYKQNEQRIAEGLGACIQKISRNFPDRARDAHQAALRLFAGNATLRNLRIEAPDPCSTSLAGLGARGSRTTCQDNLNSSGKGPALVVIPAKGSVDAFAMGKFEVTVSDINQYCSASNICDPIGAANSSLPATGISAEFAQHYLQWLSKESGRTYRLPTHVEWTHAARAKGRGLDANRNCKLNSRGIQKGGAPVNATIGQQNGWGLVNYIGNVKEWVQGRGTQLLAVGGSYATQMEECTLDSQEPSDGRGDNDLGFRVLRELTK